MLYDWDLALLLNDTHFFRGQWKVCNYSNPDTPLESSLSLVLGVCEGSSHIHLVGLANPRMCSACMTWFIEKLNPKASPLSQCCWVIRVYSWKDGVIDQRIKLVVLHHIQRFPSQCRFLDGSLVCCTRWWLESKKAKLMMCFADRAFDPRSEAFQEGELSELK